ncbi:esterase LipI isoform X2 [Patella vulgata]|nr:esterase LipI isoform X2 [Patella vulgata]XP_050405299.1 esterase LipI isoform X2 [Patella vulgata]
MDAVTNFSKLKNKYSLPEETISFLEQNNNVLGKKSTVAERRVLYEQQTELYGKRVEFDGIYKQFIAPSIKCKEGLPVDIIRPKKLPQVPTIVIYFHGGDLSTGSRRTSEDFCKYLAKSARCIVVNAEYRLGPDIKLPMQIDDAKCVVRWVKMNRGLLGAVLESKIGVAGDSFGGLIAASVVPEVDSLDFQILICPVLDLRLDQSQPSVAEFENGPCFSKSDIEKVIEQSLPNSADRFKPLASPLLQSNFNRHPTTFLLIAQIDPFRDAVYEYKQKLVEAEIDVTSYLVKGSVHSFFRLSGHFKSLCEESYQQITDFLHRLVM